VLWVKMSACSLIMLVGIRLSLAVPSTQNDHIVKDFKARVARYLDFRKNEAGSAPGRTDSPDKLAHNQQGLAIEVQSLRSDAKQGDIFTPEISDYFRRQITSILRGPEGAKIRISLQNAEPVRLTLRVNDVYPQEIPLQSTPPSLLSNLPELPKELEYRIVGRTLVLLDIVPNIVVDLLPNALPESGK